jgi:hypothetical protein
MGGKRNRPTLKERGRGLLLVDGWDGGKAGDGPCRSAGFFVEERDSAEGMPRRSISQRRLGRRNDTGLLGWKMFCFAHSWAGLDEAYATKGNGPTRSPFVTLDDTD